jgi:hypothetical protein
MMNYNNKLIKEICIKLDFRIEMIHDVINYYESFKGSKTHSFKEDVRISNI